MKTILFALLVVNLLDLLGVSFLSAKCRKEPLLQGENTWLPFAGLYKLFLMLELAVLALSWNMTQTSLVFVVMLVVPFLLDMVALVMAVKDGYSYTPKNPFDAMKEDLISLNEHRFYPVHEFSPKFFVYGLVDNAFRYVADVALAGAIVKILFFL